MRQLQVADDHHGSAEQAGLSGDIDGAAQAYVRGDGTVVAGWRDIERADHGSPPWPFRSLAG